MSSGARLTEKEKETLDFLRLKSATKGGGSDGRGDSLPLRLVAAREAGAARTQDACIVKLGLHHRIQPPGDALDSPADPATMGQRPGQRRVRRLSGLGGVWQVSKRTDRRWRATHVARLQASPDVYADAWKIRKLLTFTFVWAAVVQATFICHRET